MGQYGDVVTGAQTLRKSQCLGIRHPLRPAVSGSVQGHTGCRERGGIGGRVVRRMGLAPGPGWPSVGCVWGPMGSDSLPECLGRSWGPGCCSGRWDRAGLSRGPLGATWVVTVTGRG